MKESLRLCSCLAAFLALALSAQDATLVPERDWTSTDGKVMRASLIGFEKGQGQFRTPEGRRFVIPDDRLSMRDQVEVFVARVQSQLEVSHSADINTDFYYSKHIPSNRRFDKNHSYVAFGPNRFNLSISLMEPGVDLGGYREVAVAGAEGEPEVVFPLEEGNIRRFTRNGGEQVYLRLPFFAGTNEEKLPAVEKALAANAPTFVARGRTAAERRFTFDESESNALREVLSIYRQGSQLIAGGFLKRARLSEQTPGAADKPVGGTDAPVTTTGGGDPLEPFRKSLSQKKYGSLKWNEETVDGLGFLGADVVVRKSNGEAARAPFAELAPPDRKPLFEKRLKETFGDAKHVTSAGITVFHHPDWDSQRMNYSRSILLTLNPKGEYDLRLFAWAVLHGKLAKEIFVRGDTQQAPFPVACRPDDSYLRDRTDGTKNTLCGTYLNDKDSETALTLLGSKSIQFRIRSEENQDYSVNLQQDELEATLEAIALFQWSRQM
jgi:hypothetical protein